MKVALDDHRDHRVQNLLNLVRVRGACLVHVERLFRVVRERFELLFDECHGLRVILLA